MKDAKLIVGLLKENYIRFIQKPENLRLIQTATHSDGVNYLYILKRIFE